MASTFSKFKANILILINRCFIDQKFIEHIFCIQFPFLTFPCSKLAALISFVIVFGFFGWLETQEPTWKVAFRHTTNNAKTPMPCRYIPASAPQRQSGQVWLANSKFLLCAPLPHRLHRCFPTIVHSPIIYSRFYSLVILEFKLGDLRPPIH
jgi:hypothetical protein